MQTGRVEEVDMITGEKVRKQHYAGRAEWTEVASFLTHILREFLLLQKRFPEVHVYLDTAEPIPFLVIELEYDRLSKDDRDFLFGFGYRLNKTLQTVFGDNAPFVEVAILNRVLTPSGSRKKTLSGLPVGGYFCYTVTYMATQLKRELLDLVEREINSMGRVFYVSVKKRNRKGEPVYVLRRSYNGKVEERYLGKYVPGEIKKALEYRKWLRSVRRVFRHSRSGNILYLVGYEGVKMEEFINLLEKAGIDIVVDVRESAWSRRPEFRENNLRKFLKRNRIIYIHLPDLGNPNEVRKRYKRSKDVFDMLSSYNLHLSNESEALETLGSIVKRKRVAVMCYEKDPFACHRIVIAKELLVRGIIDEFRDLRERVDTNKVFLLCKNLSQYQHQVC